MRLAGSRAFERALEIFPGALTWSAIILPVVLSFIAPDIVAYFILLFDTYWLFKSINISRNLMMGFRRMRRDERIDWLERVKQIENPAQVMREVRSELKVSPSAEAGQELEELSTLRQSPQRIPDWTKIYHVVIVPTFKEDLQVLQSTFRAIAASNFPLDRVFVVLATEERDKSNARINAAAIKQEFGERFAHLMITEHPAAVPGEVKGKGPNITYAGRKLLTYLQERHFDPENVIVSNIDADHMLHPQYLPYLTYTFMTTPNPHNRSYQPIPVLNNNIWDAPAVSRTISIGATFWQMVESMRPRRLRNYSAHAQTLKTLIDTDFWSVKTIVEDGHQFWRTYFAYGGDHKVIPLFIPIYGDAVLTTSYTATLKAQYRQLRRWAWGISDFPFVIRNMLLQRQIPFREKYIQVYRLIEGHFSWATSALYLSFVGWLPIFLNTQFKNHVLAYTLGPTTSRLLTLALLGMAVSIWVSALLLPPRPQRYGLWRTAGMYLQWALLPVSTILFGAFPAIEAQTRLMLGKYMNTFDVTEKSRRADTELPLESVPGS
jgi:hypothetical protein